MDEASKMLQKQQEELERIRKHRSTLSNKEGLRTTLNTLFMVLALVGVVLYFWMPDRHVVGMAIIAVGMVLKVAEFFVRFMF